MYKYVFAFLILISISINAQQGKKYPCESNENYQKLNFWVGEWDVYDSNEVLVGSNKIEKILHDCAIIENWTGAYGNKGKSLFYYNNTTEEWKQVWITENATRVGGTKEKILVKEFEDGGVRFQGQYPGSKDNIIFDRTTLTPLENGDVRQLIEYSVDEGKTWNISFDAIYKKKD